MQESIKNNKIINTIWTCIVIVNIYYNNHIAYLYDGQEYTCHQLGITKLIKVTNKLSRLINYIILKLQTNRAPDLLTRAIVEEDYKRDIGKSE